MAKQNDYYTMGSTAGKNAAAGLTAEQLMSDLMLDASYLTALADSTSLTAAEQMGVKKTTATFFSSFKSAFLNDVRETQRKMAHARKPVFWGDKQTQEQAFNEKNSGLWTVLSAMDDIKSKQKEIVQQCSSIIRDAQKMMDRAQHALDTQIVNDRLYPIYDENLGQMGIRVDTASASLRQLQESTRQMIGLIGMRLPERAELVKAGLIKEEESNG
jgi:hypothetical protein